MEICLVKLANGTLAPADEVSNDELAKVKTGTQLHGKFTRMRNPAFHRKFFALIGLCFDMWAEMAPAVEYKGERIEPNKDRFRRDVTILAGYYDTTFRLDGSIRLEAKSISFASMGQEEFESLFSKVLNVMLLKVLKNDKMTESKLREAVDRVLAFD